MKSWIVWLVVLIVASAALGGCFGKKKDGNGGGNGDGGDGEGPDSIKDQDSALGNQGFEVKGGLAGEATPLTNTSAVQLDVIDVVESDADVTDQDWDKARLVLQAQVEGGPKIEASLKSMAIGSGDGQDFAGGVGRQLDIGGGTGIISSQLPKARAAFFAVGLASIKADGTTKSGNHLVFAFLVAGLRDDSTHAPLQEPNAHDLELHIFFPGNLIEGMPPIPDVPDGSLYYYFELVAAHKMDDEARTKVVDAADPPELANPAPQPVIRFLVGGNAVTAGTKEGQNNLTVTLDGSLSTDDGAIEVWKWSVAEPNATGVLPAPNDTANITVVFGETVDFNFSEKAGPKVVELTVADEKHATATVLSTFYVNYHAVLSFASTSIQPAGGGTSCRDAVNCNKHDIPFEFGFQNGTMAVDITSATPAQSVHIQIHKPGNTDPEQDMIKESETDQPLTLDKTEITDLGKRYRVWVWWEAGVSVSYDMDVFLNYELALSAPTA